MTEQTTPVSIALVGYGYWGMNLGRNIEAASNARLAAVVDTIGERAELAAQRFPSSSSLDSLDAALADPAIEAVALATPAQFHAEQAAAVIRAGKHVLVEKPLAMRASDADQLVKTSEARGVVCMVGHTFLYSEPVRVLRRYVEDGTLGSIRYLYSQRLNLGRVRSDCNALWNFGPHDVSIALFLLGERPCEVSARGSAFLQDGIDDVCFATLVFPSGIAANIHVSWVDPRKVRLLTVVGDQKMVVYDDVSADRKISLFDSEVTAADVARDEFSSMGDFQWRTRAGSIEIPHLPLREPLLTEVEAFASSCRTGEPPLTDARHGADVVRILEAIDESVSLRGSPVVIAW